MVTLVLILIALLVALGIFSYLISKKDKGVVTENTLENAAECCGEHEVCEKLAVNMQTDIIYFNDEELDVYAGISPDSYNDKQIEEFREVLYTLQKKEVYAWMKSLELRKIALPNCIKEEALLITSDQIN